MSGSETAKNAPARRILPTGSRQVRPQEAVRTFGYKPKRFKGSYYWFGSVIITAFWRPDTVTWDRNSGNPLTARVAG